MYYIMGSEEPEPVRIQIRCSEGTKQDWDKAAGAFGLTYGELAATAAKFALENDSDFRKFLRKEERRRD